MWRLVAETMKPGAHLLSFFGSRTYHRGTVAIEDAGFDIRDQIMWVYGSGYPKNHDVSKAIDKAAGAERVPTGTRKLTGKARVRGAGGSGRGYDYGELRSEIETFDTPATPESQRWEGWGTALKPAHEPIVMARKPFPGTVAGNVLAHGTGAVNIDACRVGTERIVGRRGAGGQYGRFSPLGAGAYDHQGRFPANVIHDGSAEVLDAFPTAARSSCGNVREFDDLRVNASATPGHNAGEWKAGFGDAGSAARFFYCAKASKSDRGEGNAHPTVKPTRLMAYLCRLVTQPGGVCARSLHG